jgi:hypothetical protein
MHEEMRHITKWLNHSPITGWDTFTWKLVREDNRLNTSKPLAFALANGQRKEPFVQIAHGFAQMTMEEAHHPCNSLIGRFFRDRMAIKVNGTQVVHEPPFITFRKVMFPTSIVSNVGCLGGWKSIALGKCSQRDNVTDFH